MLNYLWGSMILIGIVVAAFNGTMPEITSAAIQYSEEAVMVLISMIGIISMWAGLMNIAEKAGLIQGLSESMRPMLKYLFPSLPKDSKASQYISTNIIANVLGLGWAATPSGLKAMQELQKINKNKKVASKEMCMFMVVNMSSLQIISVNILAYRAQYNSANPSEIIGPGLLATIISSIVGVAAVKFFERWSKDR